jgi:Protein of unknown function (DUF5818)
MRRVLSLATLILVLALIHMARAQSSQKPKHPQPQNGTELIAWTQMQEPHPVQSQQPVPSPERQPDPTPDTRPQNQPAPGAQDDAQKEPAVQSFMGTVMKLEGKYVLKTTDKMTYQLDDQERAQKFEGKQVQVTGNLITGTNLIKVQDIKAAA